MSSSLSLVVCSAHSGVLSMMVVPFGAAYNDTKCLLHAAYETSVSCHLKLPDLVRNLWITECRNGCLIAGSV